MTNDEIDEQRALNSLRTMDRRKRAEMLAVLDAMAKAFPRPALAMAKKASLTLVVNGGEVGVRQGVQHDPQRMLPALRLSTVGA